MNARRSRLLENEEWLNVILSWSSLYLTLSSIKIQTHNLFISDQLRLLFKMLINKLRKLKKRLLKAHKKITFVFRYKFGLTFVNFSMHRFCSYQITNQTFWLTRSRVKRLKEEVIFLSCLLFCQMIPHRNFFRRSNLERSAQIVSNCNRFKHGEYYDSHLKKQAISLWIWVYNFTILKYL